MLTFAHTWLFAMAAAPLLVYFLLPSRRSLEDDAPAVRVPFLSRVLAAWEGSVPVRRSPLVLSIISGCSWLLLVAALARPQWLEPPMERVIPTRDMLVLVDLSTSMNHEDFTNLDGKTVDRLAALKEVLGEFLLERKGDRVGLVVFGNAPFLQAPFTTDLELCRRLLDEAQVGMAGPKTALGDAMGLAIQLFDQSEAPAKTVIALTDGNDTASAVPPVEAARVAHDRDITIHTIAMGNPETVGEEKLDTAALKGVAEATGGEFFLAMNRDELKGVYQKLDEIETREVKTVSHRPRRDIYYYPLAAALFLWMLPDVLQWLARPPAKDRDATIRLKVNPRTFAIETFDLEEAALPKVGSKAKSEGRNS